MSKTTPHNSYAGVRQTFCEKNFEFVGREARWLDVVCLIQMTNNRVARVEITDRSCQDHFGALDVKIIHTVNGDIDFKTFKFRDYLDEREDTRTDLPEERPHVWTNSGSKFEWYIAHPTKAARTKLTAAIVAYIKAFES
jgi:hypothetical protein